MSASALSGLRWTITQVLLQGNEAHGECCCALTRAQAQWGLAGDSVHTFQSAHIAQVVSGT